MHRILVEHLIFRIFIFSISFKNVLMLKTTKFDAVHWILVESVIYLFMFSIVDLKSALGKKRRDGDHAPIQRLTKMQRVYMSRLISKHGEDYQVKTQLRFWL